MHEILKFFQYLYLDIFSKSDISLALNILKAHFFQKFEKKEGYSEKF